MKKTFRLTPLQIRWILLASFAVVSVIGISWPHLPYRVETIKICPVSGTISREITHFGIKRTTTIERTALEAWIREQEPSFSPSFVPWCEYKSLLFSVRRTCYKSPPVALLDSIQDQIKESIPENRLDELWQALRSDDRPQQQLLIRDLIKEFES